MSTHLFRRLLVTLVLALTWTACQTPATDPEKSQVGETTDPGETIAGDETPIQDVTSPAESEASGDDQQAQQETESFQLELTPRMLLNNPGLANQEAPATFRAQFDTTKGSFVIEVVRAWSPQGADRFYNLLRAEYYDRTAFFRVIGGFMAQFGIHSNPQIGQKWGEATIPDDPVVKSNQRGYVTFATAGPNTRTTQVFINYHDNSRLDGQGFSPFGRVVEGMRVVDALYSDYGEGGPRGRGPNQQMIRYQGNAYLKRQFPKLDYVKKGYLLE